MIFTTESCLFLIQCHQKARRPQPPNIGFWPCPSYKAISLDYFKRLCTVENEIPKVFAILHWGTLFLHCCTICPCSLSQSGEPHLTFTTAWLYLSAMLFSIVNYVTEKSLNNTFTCQMLRQVSHHCTMSPVFCYPCPEFFKICCRHTKILNGDFHKMIKYWKWKT